MVAFIDYCGLNSLMVKYQCPPPLLLSALEKVGGAKISTKLNLRSAYNLIHIRQVDEWKTVFIKASGHNKYLVISNGFPLFFRPSSMRSWDSAWIAASLCTFTKSWSSQPHRWNTSIMYGQYSRSSWITVTFLGYILDERGVEIEVQSWPTKGEAVTSWPQPRTIKGLQRFLGFANFHCQFIWGSSSVAAPLISLLMRKPKTFKWSEEATWAFCFTKASILHHPDPSLPFIVEVSPSDNGVGAVLSHHHGNHAKMQPCSFLSRKLTHAKCNYGIRNQELLTTKAALE